MTLRTLAVVILTAGLVSAAGLSAAPGHKHGADRLADRLQMLGKGKPFVLFDLPKGRLRDRLVALPWEKRERAMRLLHRFRFPKSDVSTIHVDDEGAVLYVDQAPVFCESPPCPADAPIIEQSPNTGPTNPEPSSAVDDAFALHSKPGASNTLYLDFTGHTFSGTAWGGGATYYAKPFNTEGGTNSFTEAERAAIAEIWHRVAEDFAPFDINVTTEEPSSFGPYTGRVLITSKKQTNGADMPYRSAGGVAYVDVWGRSDYDWRYSPALVYHDNLANATNYIAEAAAHEFGHNLGLSHDGTSSTSYYGGHGSGATSWAPIMGNSYSRNVTQWSRGEYAGANNDQDDIDIITEALSLSADDHGDSRAAATPLAIEANGNVLVSDPESDPQNIYPENKGIIDSAADWDYFSFESIGGTLNLRLNPAWQSFYRSSRRGANLDVRAVLMDAGGNVIAQSDPGNDTYAELNLSIGAGTYYLAVTGIGNGN
jgi:hypothetical protein